MAYKLWVRVIALKYGSQIRAIDSKRIHAPPTYYESCWNRFCIMRRCWRQNIGDDVFYAYLLLYFLEISPCIKSNELLSVSNLTLWPSSISTNKKPSKSKPMSLPAPSSVVTVLFFLVSLVWIELIGASLTTSLSHLLAVQFRCALGARN